MSRTHYADGSPKVPNLGAFCTEPDPNHRLCGGWWCTCTCHDDWDIGDSGHITPHVDHEWRQVGDCVYCEPCAVRLYQGELASPDEKLAMAHAFDALHREIDEGWRRMREQVLTARPAIHQEDNDSG